MSRSWLVRGDARPEGAVASAQLSRSADGAPLGWLGVVEADRRPLPGAVAVDPRAIDPAGAPASAYLLWLEHRVLFDDAAVQRGRQRLLADGGFDVVTTFSASSTDFGGALLAWRGAWAPDDPFAWVAPAMRCEVGSGLLSVGPPQLPSPIVERYAGKAWPADGF